MTRARRSTLGPDAEPAGASAPHQLGHRILLELRRRILSWHYLPGHHLSEQDLGLEFEASRVPVREALRALTEQGLVEKVPNQGCFVRQPDAQAAHDLYDLRLALELFIAERLARAGIPEALTVHLIATWEPLLKVRADAPADGDALVRMDEEFHLSLARALGNPYIVSSLQDINDRLRFVRLVVVTTPHRIQTTAGEHLAIIQAIVDRDPEAARKSMRQNLQHARNRIEIAIARAMSQAQRPQQPASKETGTGSAEPPQIPESSSGPADQTG